MKSRTIAEIYSTPEMLDAFGPTYLEWPEVMLLHELIGREAEMLDLGIGAGRTSVFFIPVVKRYVGVDIAEGMIQRCARRIDSLGPRTTADFRVGDATDLGEFEDESFDLVLFSFNGIDCIPEAKRDDCFRAVRRVLRPGGRFVFSAHNARYIDHYYRFRVTKHPRRLMREIKRWRTNQMVNGPLGEHLDREQVSFWDGFYPDNPEFKHVHVKPEYQMRELERLGFSNVKALSKETGRILSADEAASTREPWVYFFCERGV
jgi:ubiquinone/menaquinone biosynthesis C-methylase UbiE